MVANEKWFGASAGFYPETIDQSLRFNRASSSYLRRTGISSSGTNQKKVTISMWLKLSNNISSNVYNIISQGSDNNNRSVLYFYNSQFRYDHIVSSTNNTIVFSPLLRDFTNFYHIAVTVDMTQSSNSDKVHFYLNGVRQPITSSSYVATNTNTYFNGTNDVSLGTGSTISSLYDGYMAEVNMLDGITVGATQDSNGDYILDEFGQVKNGVWIPKAYSGSYGTNGFRLTFGNSSAIGEDSAGSNDFGTVSNINDYDIVPDSPTNNFPTMNAVNTNSNLNLSEGNLKIIPANTSDYYRAMSTMAVPKTGKWYWEVRLFVASYLYIFGLYDIESPTNQRASTVSADVTASTNDYQVRTSSSLGIDISTEGASFSDWLSTNIAEGDIVSFAYDADNNKMWFAIDGVFQNTSGTANPATGTDPRFSSMASTEYYIGANMPNPASGGAMFNFGQDDTFAGEITSSGNTDANGAKFRYTPPTGFVGLNASSLPDTTLSPNGETQGSDFNQVVFYDGNATDDTLINVGFKPDMVHIKARNQSSAHYNIDSRRGLGTGNSFKALAFNSSIAQYTAENDQLRQLVSNGFYLDDNSDDTWYVNRSSDTYNSWSWRCGSDTPTKTFKVKVVADSTDYGHGTGSNKYQFLKSDGTTGFGTNGIDLDLTEGGTYVFDWSDSSAQSHPIRFSLTNDGTHSSGTSAGSEYTTGVVKDDSSYLTTITLPTTASGGVANLFYYCQNHSGMGAEINTNPITQKGETNFDGTILSVTQVNNDIGMSIATYTAPSGTYYFGHGLSQAPELFMVKELSGTGNWIAYHSARTPSVPNTKGLYVNSPTLPTTGSNWIQEVSATRIGITTGQLTGTGDFVLYAWHSVDGYCKVGQYEGTNSTDNAFIYTGFLPNIVWIKNVDNGQDWVIRDLKHSGYYTDGRKNPVNLGSSHSMNNPHTGGTSFMMDFLSNGFKIRGNNSDIGSSHTFMYIAWASDQTFKFSNAR